MWHANACRGWESGDVPLNRALDHQIVVPFPVRSDLSGPHPLSTQFPTNAMSNLYIGQPDISLDCPEHVLASCTEMPGRLACLVGVVTCRPLPEPVTPPCLLINFKLKCPTLWLQVSRPLPFSRQLLAAQYYGSITCTQRMCRCAARIHLRHITHVVPDQLQASQSVGKAAGKRRPCAAALWCC